MATPETRLVLQIADVNYRKMVGLFASAMSFGMYIIIFAMSVAVLHNRKTGPLAGKGLYWLLTILALITTLSFTCNVSTVFVDASWSRLGDGPDDPFKKKLTLAKMARVAPGLIYSLVSPLIFVIADSVAVWRAYILWSHSRWVKGLLLAATLINLLFWATNTIFRAIAGTAAIISGGTETLVILSIVQLLLSTGLNALASVLFGIRAWKHHARLRQSTASMTSSNSLKVLLVVTEGGLFLCVLQLISSFIAVGLLASPTGSLDVLAPVSLAQIVTDTMTDNLAAAYPSLVVVILAFQNSTQESSRLYSNSNTSSAFTRVTGSSGSTTIDMPSKGIQITSTQEKSYSLA